MLCCTPCPLRLGMLGKLLPSLGPSWERNPLHRCRVRGSERCSVAKQQPAVPPLHPTQHCPITRQPFCPSHGARDEPVASAPAQGRARLMDELAAAYRSLWGQAVLAFCIFISQATGWGKRWPLCAGLWEAPNRQADSEGLGRSPLQIQALPYPHARQSPTVPPAVLCAHLWRT